MALEILTVGAKVYTCAASSSAIDTPPSTAASWTELPNVDEAPEINPSVDSIDVSDITDTVTRYDAGRQDVGADHEFTLNHTEAAITAWEALVTSGVTYGVWFQYVYPGASKAFFWRGKPLKLGSSGIGQNEKSTLSAHATFMGFPSGNTSWKEKIVPSSTT